jgi:hypothetical protein
VDIEDGPRTVTCSGGDVMITDKQNCIDNFGGISAQCTATVDDAEGCAEATSSDPCNSTVSACTALLTCLLDQ